jgi:hypothetical protein
MTVHLPRIGITNCSRAIALLEEYPQNIVCSFWVMCYQHGRYTPDGDVLSAGDAEDLKDDLETKIPELKPGASDLKVKVVISKQNPDNAIIQISGFKSGKERSAIQQKVQNITNRLFERKLKRALQVRAGIIK